MLGGGQEIDGWSGWISSDNGPLHSHDATDLSRRIASSCVAQHSVTFLHAHYVSHHIVISLQGFDATQRCVAPHLCTVIMCCVTSLHLCHHVSSHIFCVVMMQQMCWATYLHCWLIHCLTLIVVSLKLWRFYLVQVTCNTPSTVLANVLVLFVNTHECSI